MALLPSYATINGLILSNEEATGVVWMMQTLSGWGAVQGSLSPVKKPRSAGAWAGTSYANARSLTITGTTYAPTAPLAQDAIDRLNNAVTLEAAPLGVTENGTTRTLSVLRDGPVDIVWISSQAFSWSFQVLALDPRKFGSPLSGSTFLPSSSGGLQWPDQWAQTWSASTVTGMVTLTNPGNAIGSVILRVDGPATAPQITHNGSSGSSAITFASSLVLGSGEWLTINMDGRQTLANDQSNRASYITSRGWSGFDPGVNTWSFAAGSYNAASKLTVTAYPAWN